MSCLSFLCPCWRNPQSSDTRPLRPGSKKSQSYHALAKHSFLSTTPTRSSSESAVSSPQVTNDYFINLADKPAMLALSINRYLGYMPNSETNMGFLNTLFKSFLDHLHSCLITLDEDSSGQKTVLEPLLEGLNTIYDIYEKNFKGFELSLRLPDIITLLLVPNLPEVFKKYIVRNNQSFFGKNNATHTYNLYDMIQLMRKSDSTFFNNVLIIFTDILRSPDSLKLELIPEGETIKDLTSFSPVIKDLLLSLEHLHKHSNACGKHIPFDLDLFKTYLDCSFLNAHSDNPKFIFFVYESIFYLFRHTWFSENENTHKHKPSIQQGDPPLITSLETQETRNEDRIIPFFERIERLYDPCSEPPYFSKPLFKDDKNNQDFQGLMFHRYTYFILNELDPSRQSIHFQLLN